MNKPQKIFAGVDGSFFFRRKNAKKAITNGVRVTTKNGFIL
jgi:hypothetical protein